MGRREGRREDEVDDFSDAPDEEQQFGGGRKSLFWVGGGGEGFEGGGKDRRVSQYGGGEGQPGVWSETLREGRREGEVEGLYLLVKGSKEGVGRKGGLFNVVAGRAIEGCQEGIAEEETAECFVEERRERERGIGRERRSRGKHYYQYQLN